MADELEQVQFLCRECFVYRLPPRKSTKGHRAADWGLDKPLWTGRMKVWTKGATCTVSLIDTKTGQLFAEAPIRDGDLDTVVEAVVDSSRYFVLRVENGAKHAFLGVGFQDRAESFDFNVALQDYVKSLTKAKQASVPYESKNDFSLKEGEKITISIKKKPKAATEENDDSSSKPSSTASSMISLGNIGTQLEQMSFSSPSTSSSSSSTAPTTTSSTNPFVAARKAEAQPQKTSQPEASEKEASNPFESNPFGEKSSSAPTNANGSNDWVAF